MKAGAIVAQGDPRHVMTAELVEEVFGLRLPDHRRPGDAHPAGHPALGHRPTRRSGCPYF